MIVLVELSEIADYGYGGEVTWRKEIGSVYGPFSTAEGADAYGEKLNDERGGLTDSRTGRFRRFDRMEFKAVEVVSPAPEEAP